MIRNKRFSRLKMLFAYKTIQIIYIREVFNVKHFKCLEFVEFYQLSE